MDPDEQPPGSPADTLHLIERQRTATSRRISVDPLVYYLPWAVAWLVGFGLLFLRFGPDQRVIVSMPSWLPLTAMFAMMVVAALISSIIPGWAGRQLTGESSRRGAAYGAAWGLTFTGIAATADRFTAHMPADQGRLLWSWLSVAGASTLFIAGGALFRQYAMVWLGVLLCLVNIAGVYAGPGWHELFVSIGGGVGLIVTGAYQSVQYRAGIGREATT